MTRTDWLKALVSLDRPLDDILSALNEDGWDSDVALVTVCRQTFSEFWTNASTDT